MKSHISYVLFALLTTTACSDRKTPTATISTTAPSPRIETETPPVQAPVAQPLPKPEPVKSVAEEAHPIPTKYGDAMAQGKELAGKGDHARAREMFESAARLDKKRAEPHIELARLFITTGDKALAMAAANKGVKLAPESTQAWNTLGRAELLRFNYDGAVTAFREATELAPDNVWAWNNLGFAQLQQKHYAEAADALAEATSRKGATGYMFNNLGTAYEQLDQLDNARMAFDKGAELGSVESKASRKRLDGVKTIVVVKDVRDAKPGSVKSTDEPMVEPEIAPEATKIEDPKLDAPKVDEPKVEEPKAPEVEAPKADVSKTSAPKVDAPKAETSVPKSETVDAGVHSVL